MSTFAESLPVVSADFDGRHLDGHYRVTGAAVVAYYADQVKFADLDEAVPPERIAQWLLKDMAGHARRI
jgi:hypothetical protein